MEYRTVRYGKQQTSLVIRQFLVLPYIYLAEPSVLQCHATVDFCRPKKRDERRHAAWIHGYLHYQVQAAESKTAGDHVELRLDVRIDPS